jgi:hypothetical protein
VILGQQAVFGVVGAEFEEFLVVESRGWHGFRELAAVLECCNALKVIWTLVFATEGGNVGAFAQRRRFDAPR